MVVSIQNKTEAAADGQHYRAKLMLPNVKPNSVLHLLFAEAQSSHF